MEQFEVELQQLLALKAMVVRAEVLGLSKGVAFILVQHKGANVDQIRISIVNHTFTREPNPDIDGDKGTNYFGIAMEKLAVMMAYGKDSGQPQIKPKNGESGYRGGAIVKYDDFTIYTGFSGGTEDQDIEIAWWGMEVLFAGTAQEEK